jgi:[amino group carrier protein]-lysine/ornithine hydrolase
MAESVSGLPDEGIEMLEGLLKIPSPSGSEGAAVDFLVSWMQRRGFDARRDGAGNAVGILHPPAGGQAGTSPRELVLLGHIDTVSGHPPVTRRDDRLYGRGAVDAKGPLAAFATAAAMAGARPGWRITVVGAVEEEAATSKGARHIARTRTPDMAIVGEPTGWQKIALGYKGRLLADLAVVRPMSHRAGPQASAPEMAIAYWNSVATRLSEINAGWERIWDQVQGTVRGFDSSDDGLEETARLAMGFRLPLHVTPEQLQHHLRELANGHRLRFHAEEVAFRAEKNTALVRALLGAVRAHGGDPGFVVKTGTSDMNVVGPLWRCPIATYGPGDSALDHTPDEHVDLAEWRSGAAVLAETIRRVTSCGIIGSDTGQPESAPAHHPG